jgi:hypothetical protein
MCDECDSISGMLRHNAALIIMVLLIIILLISLHYFEILHINFIDQLIDSIKKILELN